MRIIIRFNGLDICQFFFLKGTEIVARIVCIYFLGIFASLPARCSSCSYWCFPGELCESPRKVWCGVMGRGVATQPHSSLGVGPPRLSPWKSAWTVRDSDDVTRQNKHQTQTHPYTQQDGGAGREETLSVRVYATRVRTVVRRYICIKNRIRSDSRTKRKTEGESAAGAELNI